MPHLMRQIIEPNKQLNQRFRRVARSNGKIRLIFVLTRQKFVLQTLVDDSVRS